MLQVCWSPKGGSGTSVVAAALAVQAAAKGRDALLVDLGGDQSAIFGVEGGEGIGDWFAAPDDVGPDALRSLEVDVGDRLRLLRTGRASTAQWSPERMAVAMTVFESSLDLVVVDAGRQTGCGLPGGAATLRDRVATMGLAEVALEDWEEVVDPAGHELPEFKRCAIEIDGLLEAVLPRFSEGRA